MQVDTRVTQFQIALSANSTQTSITPPNPQILSPGLSAPANSGVILMGENIGAMCSNGLKIIPYGVGSAANTGLMNVYGWNSTTENAQGTGQLWIPYLLVAISYTLSATTGVANSILGTTQMFAANVTITSGNANVSCEALSATSPSVGHLMVDSKGSQYITLMFSTNSSSTSNNALVAKV